MHFVLQTPSLQHLAGVKIVTHLWNQRDIYAQIARTFNGQEEDELREDRKKWKEIEEKVRSKVCDLPLPEQCKQQLLNFFQPLGMEIITWCHYQNGERNNLQSLNNLLGNKLRWTMHGSVDYVKSAELLVKDERLSIERRYEMACLNCLENEARELFERMDVEGRQKYVNMVRRWSTYNNIINELIVFFTCAINGVGRDEYPSTLRSDICLFNNSLFSVNRAVCEYVFKKLSQRDKEQVFEKCQMLIFSRNLIYCLSLMNEEQQRRLFQNCRPFNVLLCLLRWPMQSLFVEAVECVWGFVSDCDCTIVLSAIIDNIQKGFQDYDYAHLFRECWRLSPADYKQYYLDRFGILNSILQTKREEFITLILNEAPSYQVENYFAEISAVLIDDSAISDAALMECKQTALLNSSNDRDNVEKRLRSQNLSRLVDVAMESRIKSRENQLDWPPPDLISICQLDYFDVA